MDPRILRSLFALLAITLTAAFLTQPLVAEDEPTDEPAVDRYAVPDGDVDELMAFIDGIESFRPTTREAYIEHRGKAMDALVEAAEAILAAEQDAESDAYVKATEILLTKKAQGINTAEADEQAAILQEVLTFLGDVELTRSHAGMAQGIAQGLEHSDNAELTIEAYKAFAEIFSASDDPALSRFGDGLAGKVRRAELVGNEMELTGTMLDGTDFDWKTYRGKIVLVDFWATWCGPCVAEYPNIRENYDRYHEQGFDVVGVSSDRDRAALEGYIEDKDIPWVNLFEGGERNPASELYGITGIPTMFLVDREGNVVSTSARGPELTRLLEEMMGSPEEDSSEETN